jgi:hypothetical protein
MKYPVGTLLKCDSWRMPVWYKHGHWVILELNVLGGRNAKLKQIGGAHDKHGYSTMNMSYAGIYEHFRPLSLIEK